MDIIFLTALSHHNTLTLLWFLVKRLKSHKENARFLPRNLFICTFLYKYQWFKPKYPSTQKDSGVVSRVIPACRLCILRCFFPHFLAWRIVLDPTLKVFAASLVLIPLLSCPTISLGSRPGGICCTSLMALPAIFSSILVVCWNNFSPFVIGPSP